MINGYTNAVIRGDFVRSVYCPDDVRTPMGKKGLDCWSYVHHPYLLESSRLIIAVDMKRMNTPNAQTEFQEVLAAALGLNNTFMEISGGFNAPLPYPGGMLPSSVAKPRGSEHKCVWEYRTLEQEDEISSAYIPDWFVNEKWLDIYRDIPLDFETSF
jgi:hypothetical protein